MWRPFIAIAASEMACPGSWQPAENSIVERGAGVKFIHIADVHLGAEPEAAEYSQSRVKRIVGDTTVGS